MELFVFTFAGLALAFGAMGLGALVGRAPLRRGCGPAGATDCDGCVRPCARRRARDAGEPRP